jgi:hypothetical protein
MSRCSNPCLSDVDGIVDEFASARKSQNQFDDNRPLNAPNNAKGGNRFQGTAIQAWMGRRMETLTSRRNSSADHSLAVPVYQTSPFRVL